MQCPECNTENPEAAKFCLECGARLTVICTECSTPLPPGAKFCLECGAPVSAAAAVAHGEPRDAIPERIKRYLPQGYAERLVAAGGQMAGERRVVTILFSDVKGSSAMARTLDPEDVMEIMDGAFDVLIEPIVRYEGTLARLMGDAILAFFGAPIAHEDDPERACRAALGIIAGAQAYAARLGAERGISGFSVRVGINTGLVVVGEVGSDLRVEYTAMGDAINLAARMENAAEPGTILITEATHKLVAPLFETEALPAVEVKGWEEPVAVHRVLAARQVPGKVRGIEGLQSPLVGRAAEIAALQAALERLHTGVGGIVTIVGEAGIGKSRLVAELRQAGVKQASPPRWVEGRCLSYGTSTAYLLWLDVLRCALGVTADDTPLAVRGNLHDWVDEVCPQRFDDVYPYLCRLMSLSLDEACGAALDRLDGQQLRTRTFRAVESAIRGNTAARPVVLVLEDLHWADPTSLELLEHMLAATEHVPLLIVCVFRPEREHGSWRLLEIAGRLPPERRAGLCLEPLSTGESDTLLTALLGVSGLPDELRQRILVHAEGNPFYVEEIVRSLINDATIAWDKTASRWRATRALTGIAIPNTLHGVLAARIDRLQEDTKQVLQMASVIGRVFLYRLLEAIVEEERRLDAHLATLQRQEMIRERAPIPELEYIFKHELTREAAYGGLLRKRRRAFHRQVAEALERLFPERIQEQLALLAHHWEQAGDNAKAVVYLVRAGDQARLAYAHQEAIRHYERAQSLLGAAKEADRIERLPIEEGLGDVRSVLAEHEQALDHYARARDLVAADPSPSSERLAGICRKTAMLYERKGDYATAFRWLEQAMETLAAEVTLEMARIRLAGAGIHSRQGQHAQALEWCQAGLEIACQTGGQAEQAHGTYLLGTIHGHLGHSAQEIACARESLALYEEMGDLFGQAKALNNLGIACKERGDWPAAVGHFQRAIALEERLGNPHGVAKLTNNLGNVLAGQGHLDGAAQAYRTSLDIWERIDFPLGVALSWSNLGNVCVERGEWEQAQEHYDRALLGFQEIRSQHFLPEVFRGLALVHLGRGELKEARQMAVQSLELAAQLNMDTERAASLGVLGQAYLALGQWSQAQGALASSLSLSEEQSNRRQTAESLFHLGRLYLAMARSGDTEVADKAARTLTRAAAIFEELGAQRSVAKVMEVLG